MCCSPLYVFLSTNGQVRWAAHLAALSSVDREIKERSNNSVESSVGENSCEGLAAWEAEMGNLYSSVNFYSLRSSILKHKNLL